MQEVRNVISAHAVQAPADNTVPARMALGLKLPRHAGAGSNKKRLRFSAIDSTHSCAV